MSVFKKLSPLYTRNDIPQPLPPCDSCFETKIEKYNLLYLFVLNHIENSVFRLPTPVLTSGYPTNNYTGSACQQSYHITSRTRTSLASKSFQAVSIMFCAPDQHVLLPIIIALLVFASLLFRNHCLICLFHVLTGN